MKTFLKKFKHYRLLKYLLLVDFTLLILHLKFGPSWDFFNFDREWNLPTSWSSLQFLAAAWLWFTFTEITKNDKIKGIFKIVYQYLGTGLFCYLAIDELGQIHEWFGGKGGQLLLETEYKELFNLNAVFAWLWVVLPVILLVGSGIVYLGLKLLTRSVFWHLIIGISIFLLGAYGMEVLGWLTWHNVLDLNYWYVITIEELLELIGISIIVNEIANYQK